MCSFCNEDNDRDEKEGKAQMSLSKFLREWENMRVCEMTMDLPLVEASKNVYYIVSFTTTQTV